MSTNFSETSARALAEKAISNQTAISTQEIIDSGIVPELKGFTVMPGKVSDSIFGGLGSYTDKNGKNVEFENPHLKNTNGDHVRILIRTEQISTHDINRGSIPFKDQILSLNHNFMRQLVAPFMPHAQLLIGSSDTDIVSFALNVNRFPIENVVRAYLAKTTTSTSLYQQYCIEGKKEYCGIALYYYENELRVNERLPFVMDTPSTKSSEHDQSVAPEKLFKVGLFDGQHYRSIRNNSLVAFGVVSGYLRQRGIILVDTKTEHGVDEDGKIWAIDELYTMDSSRYWKMKNDGTILTDAKGEPVSFSKEFARGISKGADGYTDQQRVNIAVRYMEGIELLTGKSFTPDLLPWHERVVNQLHKGVASLRFT